MTDVDILPRLQGATWENVTPKKLPTGGRARVYRTFTILTQQAYIAVDRTLVRRCKPIFTKRGKLLEKGLGVNFSTDSMEIPLILLALSRGKTQNEKAC